MNKKVLAFMITRANTEDRISMFKETLNDALETAGYKFDLHLHIQENDKLASEMSGLHELTFWPENVGQHPIMNEMISKAKEHKYDYLLRLDDDIQFLTKRWLAKMIEAHDKLGDNFIISPTIKGLIHQPQSSEEVEVNGIKVKFLTEAIGGICRLHPVSTLTQPNNPYISDIRKPLGFGDATGLAHWCQQNSIWMVYLSHVRVKHKKGTLKQRKDDPIYHEYQNLFQHIPYIPNIK